MARTLAELLSLQGQVALVTVACLEAEQTIARY